MTGSASDPGGAGHQDVSRETPPSHAAGVFASRMELAEQYADLLATEGVTRGLIGPRELPRLWERHIMNSAVVLPRVPQGASVADVGTGAGLPWLGVGDRPSRPRPSR